MITDVELAITAARAGAEVVLGKYGTWETRIDKEPGDFATEADVEAEQAILDTIRAGRPDDAFLGEEGGYVGREDAGRVWLVDPLCGTLNFAAKTPLFCVNVALRDADHQDLAAAVADPCSGEVFWTDGEKAMLRGADGVDLPLVPDVGARLVDINVDRGAMRSGPLPTAIRLLTTAEFEASFGPRVVSSSLALAWVAAGRRAAYLTDGARPDSVHFAAGLALCRAAGCVVTDLAGEPLYSGAGGLLAAADAETHAELLGLLSRA
ncbi:inositol monophosphatase family protein [Nocardioides speluncae]|uniref:inositol monophosphatase family protein n=1 Tax=Nocardioides speluncae TaxID=2670337 RepID=UPI000D69C34E|nr:inositol monophosphatase family protein [Nocardioides speluncae]